MSLISPFSLVIQSKRPKEVCVPTKLCYATMLQVFECEKRSMTVIDTCFVVFLIYQKFVS